MTEELAAQVISELKVTQQLLRRLAEAVIAALEEDEIESEDTSEEVPAPPGHNE